MSEASSAPWDSNLWTMVRRVDSSGFVAPSMSPDGSSLGGVEGSSWRWIQTFLGLCGKDFVWGGLAVDGIFMLN